MRNVSLVTIFSSLLMMTHSLMEVDDPDPVNISAILDQFMIGYDKRVRPNYVHPAWLRSNINENTHG